MGTRIEMNNFGDERALLCQFLDRYRECVIEKVAGLTHEQINTRYVNSDSTIAGLLKHLALVEDSWFTDRLAALPMPEPWASAPFSDDVDWDFHSASDNTLDELVELYRDACDRSRAVLATVNDLGQMTKIASGRGERCSSRWVLIHMIEETARHLGHMDILRELTDGTTGE